MKHIKNFEIDKTQDSFYIFNSIKIFIEDFADQNFLSNYFQKYEKILDCPANILKLKFKKIIYSNFDHKKGKIILNCSYMSIFKDYLFFILSIFIIKIFGKSKNKKENYELIIDDIEDINQIKRFKNLYSKFSKFLIIYDNSSKFNDLSEINNFNLNKINSRLVIPNKNFLKGKFFQNINLINNILLLSIKEKTNFIVLFKTIFLSYVKNKSIFLNNISKFLIHDRIYKTCPIRNYLFKKEGGSYATCTQLHLAESGLSFYADTDILFLFGNENYTKKKIEFFGGNIRKTLVSGSHKMESDFFLNRSKKLTLNEIDLLIIGINLNYWIYNSEKVFKSYYTYLDWIKTFSLKNPKLNIVYKHHSNFIKDEKEEEILKDTNIKIVVKSSSGENSYDYLANSKMIVSFGSTMILEGRSINKNCFFLDPNSSASTFYKNLNYLEKIILKTFDDFEDTAKKVINNQAISGKIDSNSICIKSDKVSDNIYKHLKNL